MSLHLNPNKKTLLTDRSRYIQMLQCRRLGWWTSNEQKHYDDLLPEGALTPKGIQLCKKQTYLVLGSAVHLGCQLSMQNQMTWAEIETQMTSLFKEDDIKAEPDHPDLRYAIREQEDLAKALVLVWRKERQQRFLEEYRVLAIEPEVKAILYENNEYQVVGMFRHDAVIERLVDGALLQWELKTKQAITNNWLNSWEHNYQLIGQQLGLRQWAMDNGYGDRPIVGAYIEALIKGRREKDETGLYRQQTPLIYAYVKKGDGLLIEDVISQSWKRGWTKSLVSEFMPLERWINNELPSEITSLKAVVVPPIRPSEGEIEEAREQWGLATIQDYEWAQEIHDEADIERGFLLNKYFPQNTEHCWRYGKCSMYEMCFNEEVQRDPIGSGIYQVREPHHNESLED